MRHLTLGLHSLPRGVVRDERTFFCFRGMKPVVQISLDVTSLGEALATAALARRAGVDWLDAGTPLILAEGLHGVRVPVQAVGGLTGEQAIRTPGYGAPLVVIGAPLAIDADSFKTASGDLESTLRLICDRVHAYGDTHRISS